MVCGWELPIFGAWEWSCLGIVVFALMFGFMPKLTGQRGKFGIRHFFLFIGIFEELVIVLVFKRNSLVRRVILSWSYLTLHGGLNGSGESWCHQWWKLCITRGRLRSLCTNRLRGKIGYEWRHRMGELRLIWMTHFFWVLEKWALGMSFGIWGVGFSFNLGRKWCGLDGAHRVVGS